MAPARELEHLIKQVRLFGAVGTFVISTNVPVRKDGQPIANGANPDDPGAALYWSTNAFKDRVMACDKWDKLYDNIHALGLAIEHLRGLERAGATQVLDRAFTAFGALPAAAAAPVIRPWWEVLGFKQGMLSMLSVAVTDARFRELIVGAHPDKGGSTAAVMELKRAQEEARRHYGGD